MRVEVLKLFRLRLVRSVALLSVAGLAAGCSSDVVRFDDGFYTGAVPQATRAASVQQGGSVDQMSTGSVPRGNGMAMPMYGASATDANVHTATDGGYRQQPYASRSNGGGSMGAEPSYGAPARGEGGGIQRASLAPPSTASAPGQSTYRALEPSVASASPAPVETPQEKRAPGWNAGPAASQVTLRPGETIYSLSKRYGIPAKAILEANNMKSARDAQAGQTVKIPSYSYGQHVPVSAPDNDPKTRQATLVPTTSHEPAPAPVRTAESNVSPVSGAHSVVVAPGDSLAGIARRNNVSVAELQRANGMNNSLIRVGQKLVLPSGRPESQVASLENGATRNDGSLGRLQVPPPAQPGPKAYEPPRAETKSDTKPEAKADRVEPAPAAAAAAPKVADDEPSVAAKSENQVATAVPDATGIDQFRWPAQGRIIKRFGDKVGARRSDGIDISVPRGTPVKAAENGVVIYAGDGLKEFGNTVLVKHDDGLVTVYGNADSLLVKRGETVKRGEEIATAGMSGDTEVPKLHFEVRKNSAPVDPMTYLR